MFRKYLKNIILTQNQSYMAISKTKHSTIISPSNTTSAVSIESLVGEETGIVVVGLNFPSTKNALSASMTTSLFKAVDYINVEQNARVLILRSLVPGVFCAGADLKERLKLSNREVAATVERLSSLSKAIEDIKIPTIAAIDGVAFGGGLEITLGCDFRIVADISKLGLVETKWAIMPAAGGSQRLPKLINPSLAKELIFCAKVIDGNEAAMIGLANHVVKQNSASDAAYQKARKIAHDILLNGPLAVNMAKLAINKGLGTDIVTGCKLEQLCYAQLIPTQDRIEGLLAFKEKRTPNYKGE